MSESAGSFGSNSSDAERLTALEIFTRDWRFSKACRHREKAETARAEGRHTAETWHRDRATGLRNRFETLRKCGQFDLIRRCSGCGHETHRVAALCSNWRLCDICRAKYQARYRARFHEARERVIRRPLPRGVSEKFVTLTSPHIHPVEDARMLSQAFGRFREGLVRYLAKYRGMSKRQARRLAYVRVLEITPGNAGGGHAHLHLWAMLPFVDKRVLAVLWWRALPYDYREACRWVPLDTTNLDRRDMRAIHYRIRNRAPVCSRADAKTDISLEIPYPSVDIQAVGDDVASELIKYLVKNRKAGEFIPSEIEAELYQAMDGRRSVATSRGFWTDVQPVAHCQECGTVGDCDIRLTLNATGQAALDRAVRQTRGPPRETSFLDTEGISPSVLEITREFDAVCHEEGTPDSSWRHHPGWARRSVDTRSDS